MRPKVALESIEGVQLRRYRERDDGTVFGAVRLEADLPAVHVKIHRQGWVIAQSASEAPEVADALGLTSVPSDVLLLRRRVER